MKPIIIYTDGACKSNQDELNRGGYGAVLEFQGHIREISGFEENTSNNRMELMAVIKALEALKRKDYPVVVYSDSAYIVNCFRQKWYVSWMKNGWKNKKKQDVKNKDLWQRLFDLVELLDFSIYKIKGHLSPSSKQVDKWYESFIIEEHKTSKDDFIKLLEMNAKVDAIASSAAEEGEIDGKE